MIRAAVESPPAATLSNSARPSQCSGSNGSWRASPATRATPVIRAVRKTVSTWSPVTVSNR